MTESSFFDLDRGCRVHYLRFGHGPRLMIALHGFGDTNQFFLPLEQALAANYTVYAIDLPYHGQTIWPASGYQPTDIESIVRAILEREGKLCFSWLGYSLGGRIILSTLNRFASRLEAVFLIAPDGMGTRGLGLPSMVPMPIRRIWVRGLQRPDRVLSLAGHLHRRRLIDGFTLRFLRFFLSADDRRQCLLQTWLSLDHFKVQHRQVRRRLLAHTFPVIFILGRQDKLVSISATERLAAGIPQAKVVILEGDHYSVVREGIGEIIAGS